MDNSYQNSKIYKIVDNGYTKCYIGSTYNALCKRMYKHREAYKRYLDGKCQRTTSYELFDEFGVDNCKIELVESYPCCSRDELNAREGYWIRQTECVNRVVVGRTRKEYYYEHKDEMNTTRKINAQKNVERENARKIKWADENKEKVKESCRKNYEKRRSYLIEKIVCECGCRVSRMGLISHCKTPKHLELMNKKSI